MGLNVPAELPGGVSVVVPVYNSELTLDELVMRLETSLRSLSRRFEAILVNDGSRDGSWGIVEREAAGREWLRGIDLMRNYGQHNALLCGIRAARFATIVTLDDDLQHPPEEIPRLLAALTPEIDVVYGAPRAKQHGRWRNAASLVTRLALQNVMGAETARHVGPFRAFRSRLREAFAGYHGPLVSIDVMLTWGTRRFAVVFTDHRPRARGRSNYTFQKLLTYALTMITGFSVWPLQLASLVGLAATLLGLIIFVYVVGRTVLQGSIPGFPFIASTVALFSGTQLFALGVIGEYVARIHVRASGQPSYTIRHHLDGGSADAPG